MASGVIQNTIGTFGHVGMFMSEAVGDDVKVIESNKNLNTAEFTSTGKYVCNSASIGATLSNVPDNQKLFTLLVYNPHNSDTGVLGTANYRYRIRILISFGGDIYTQRVHCEGNTNILFESWYKVSQTAHEYRKLLWENPHKNYWEAADEIVLSSDDYDYLDFEMKMTSSMTPYYVERIGNITANGTFLLARIGVQTDAITNNFIIGRSCTFSSRTRLSVTIGIIARWGKSTVETHRGFAIPVRIYGIKYS